MTLRSISGLKKFASLAALSAALAGCVSPTAGRDGLYATPIGDAPVTTNPTAYSQALVCIGDHARTRGVIGPRVAVGRIIDYTGKVDVEGGRRITQGASLMAITAFAKAGARLVERFDTSVSELELRYANNRLISDGQNAPPRPIVAGQVPGSDYYLVGGITELNYNIRSTGVDAYVGDRDATDPKGTFTGKLFVMNIGLDLRLVDTKSLEVIDVVSYQKQIIGRELRAGVFTFGNDNIFDIGVGERALEPIQMAVRAGVERAVVEMMANLYGIANSTVCADAIQAGGDPAGSATIGGNFRATAAPAEQARRRVDANAWHNNRDGAIRGRLNGETGEASEPAPMMNPAAPIQPAGRPTVNPANPQVSAQAAPTARSSTMMQPGPAVLVTAPTFTNNTAVAAQLRGMGR
jgi:curli production assembly/transport component CsgG/holdfast attachment protein HfaB